MHYGFNNKKVPRYIDGEQLSEPDKKRDLGLIFTSNLNWKIKSIIQITQIIITNLFPIDFQYRKGFLWVLHHGHHQIFLFIDQCGYYKVFTVFIILPNTTLSDNVQFYALKTSDRVKNKLKSNKNKNLLLKSILTSMNFLIEILVGLMSISLCKES